MVEWFTDVYGALSEVESDDELHDHMDRLSETLEEVAELTAQAQRQSRLLFLEMEQLEAEQDAEEGRAPAAPEPSWGCSIEIVEFEAGPCIRCCRKVGSGLIGWRWQPESGPLCDRCLGDVDVELGTVLAMVQRMRELATWDQDRVHLAMDDLLALARAYAAATNDAWPLRSLGVEHLLAEFLEFSEADRGKIRLSDRERNRDGQPS